ncbi:hypothetical protein Syun_008571 [Stephania yunnanensis]|uniref:Uncharacterized protein n=1 Tax=Stephania yunnanensis TaxID=152371 RepID=A0AAP0PNA3_9MAGN
MKYCLAIETTIFEAMKYLLAFETTTFVAMKYLLAFETTIFVALRYMKYLLAFYNIHGYEVPPRLRNNGLRRNEVPPRQCRSNFCRDEMSSRQQDFKIVPSSAVEISFDIYEDIITQPPTPIRRSFEWSKEAMLEYVEARNSQFSLVQDQETEFYTISNQDEYEEEDDIDRCPGRRSTIWSKEAILEWLENQETDICSACQDEYEEEDDIDRCPGRRSTIWMNMRRKTTSIAALGTLNSEFAT